MKIGSGILNVDPRTPALLAQTAAGLDALSGGRAMGSVPQARRSSRAGTGRRTTSHWAAPRPSN